MITDTDGRDWLCEVLAQMEEMGVCTLSSCLFIEVQMFIPAQRDWEERRKSSSVCTLFDGPSGSRLEIGNVLVISPPSVTGA